MMLKLAILATGLVCAGQVGATEIPLKNADFEQAIKGPRIPGWSRTQHAGVGAYEVSSDTASFSQGKQSLRMRRTTEQVYGLIMQRVESDSLAGKQVELVASLKTAKVGKKGWVMLLNFKNHNNVIDQVRAAPLVGNTKWKDVTIRKLAPPNTTAIEVGFMLLDGGTGWIDNVRLRTVDEAAKDAKAGKK